MKLPLFLAGAGLAVALALAYDSGALTGGAPDAPGTVLVRRAAPIDGSGVAAAPARGAPSYPLPPEAADDELAQLDDPETAASSGFGFDPLGGGLDPSMLVGLGQGGHVGKAAPSDVPVPDGVRLVTWEELVLLDYEPPTPFAEDDYTKEEIFPAEVLAFDGQKVALEGFMEPLTWKGDKVTSFILSPYPPGCCFGGMPGFDEWVEVATTDPDGVDYHAYRSVRAIGAFAVGEQFDDYGYLRNIYRLAGEEVENLW